MAVCGVSSGWGVARRLISVPVEFLRNEQVAAYGRFDGVPSRAELERFFLLADADRRRVDPTAARTTGWGMHCNWAQCGSWVQRHPCRIVS